MMIRQLEKDGLIRPYTDNKDHLLRLSDAGENVVQQIEKHCNVLEKIFRTLGTPAATAKKDAAAVEPYLSRETYAALCNQ